MIDKKKKLDEIKLNLLLEEEEIEPYSALSEEDSLRLEMIEKELSLLRPYNGLLNNTRNIEFNDSDSGSGSKSHFNNLKKYDFSNSKSNINDDSDINSNNDNNQDNSNDNGDDDDDDNNDDDDDIHSDDNDNNDSKKKEKR